ncbi:MAG: hypothetical protein RL497_984 [Pseudomonadota bacterium]|jgi:hypothetical protein
MGVYVLLETVSLVKSGGVTLLARAGGLVGHVVRAIIGPRPELLLDDELELLELLELLDELELLEELEVLPEELELLDELELLPEELELLELLDELGPSGGVVQPASKLAARTAAGTKRVSACWRNTNAFIGSS